MKQTEKELAQAVLDAALMAEYFGDDEVAEIYESLKDEDDITNGKYRIIKTDMLEEALAEELEDDAYNTASFSAWFLADMTNFSMDAILALQEKNCHEDIHLAVEQGEGFEYMAAEAISADGAGHYFAQYDGHEIEIGEYSLFRVN